MTFSLYNTLTRKKDIFQPIDPKNIRVYTCGPTVYNFAHIGNARSAVVPDLLIRVLRYHYGASAVIHSRNFTDIDDKIIDAAEKTGEPIPSLTKRYAEFYLADMAALGVMTPNHMPWATHYIPAMIAMIENLIAHGHAYQAEGHVLFHVPSYKDYGCLSHRNRDDMIAGARVEVAPYKKDPADFVLWKPSTGTQPGWDSPFGFGRPGWHLECSAMNADIHGAHFDIHTGGEDLIFPHHENEIAQSVCAHKGQTYVNYWMHTGFLTMRGEKMAKSLGNTFYVHDLIKSYPGEALRYALLSAHYRQPLEWSDDIIEQSRRTLDRYYQILRDLKDVECTKTAAPDPQVLSALDDDLNTPLAFAALAALSKTTKTKEDLKASLLATGQLMGFLQNDPEAWFKFGLAESGLREDEIEKLINARSQAKKEKDYQKADAIRAELLKNRIQIEDTAQGTTYKIIS